MGVIPAVISVTTMTTSALSTVTISCYRGLWLFTGVLFLFYSHKIGDLRLFSVFRINNENVVVYLIEEKQFFDRDGIYGDSQGDYPDNLERFQFFCRQVLKLLKELKLKTDIIHCHDWHTALVPVYLKENYRNDPFYANTRTVLTIHNLAMHGACLPSYFKYLDISP